MKTIFRFFAVSLRFYVHFLVGRIDDAFNVFFVYYGVAYHIDVDGNLIYQLCRFIILLLNKAGLLFTRFHHLIGITKAKKRGFYLHFMAEMMINHQELFLVSDFFTGISLAVLTVSFG